MSVCHKNKYLKENETKKKKYDIIYGYQYMCIMRLLSGDVKIPSCSKKEMDVLINYKEMSVYLVIKMDDDIYILFN